MCRFQCQGFFCFRFAPAMTAHFFPAVFFARFNFGAFSASEPGRCPMQRADEDPLNRRLFFAPELDPGLKHICTDCTPVGSLSSITPQNRGVINAPTIDTVRVFHLFSRPFFLQCGIQLDLFYSLRVITTNTSHYGYRVSQCAV